VALGLDGLRIGVWTSPDELSGCTVVLPPDGSLGAVAVRGVAPGTREAVALGPSGKLTVCHAVVLAGGSAYGLAAADGVMRWLEDHDIGYRIPIGVVPIVGAAIVLDGSVAVPESRPAAEAGRAACDAATTDDPPEGTAGAGAGCTVAKTGGIEHAWRGGQGIAVRRHGDVVVGALVVNNAVGEIVGEDGELIAASRAPEGAPRYPYDEILGQHRDEALGGIGDDVQGGPSGPSENTVIGCVVTNATLTKAEAVRVADLAHGGVSRAIRPAHTHYDGDALFCLATQQVPTHVDLVSTLAVEAVAEACRRGPLAATGRDGLPGLADHPSEG
jgi:L-aminopeptidase/D-esterase-like protein